MCRKTPNVLNITRVVGAIVGFIAKARYPQMEKGKLETSLISRVQIKRNISLLKNLMKVHRSSLIEIAGKVFMYISSQSELCSELGVKSRLGVCLRKYST